jgi:hypothetical protein
VRQLVVIYLRELNFECRPVPFFAFIAPVEIDMSTYWMKAPQPNVTMLAMDVNRPDLREQRE